jgi:excisionase family DNA binding protein
MSAQSPPEPPVEDLGLLTYEEAAAYLGPSFTARQLKQWTTDGLIEGIPIGRRTFIERDELDGFIERLRRRAPRIRAKRGAHGRKARAQRGS